MSDYLPSGRNGGINLSSSPVPTGQYTNTISVDGTAEGIPLRERNSENNAGAADSLEAHHHLYSSEAPGTRYSHPQNLQHITSSGDFTSIGQVRLHGIVQNARYSAVDICVEANNASRSSTRVWRHQGTNMQNIFSDTAISEITQDNSATVLSFYKYKKKLCYSLLISCILVFALLLAGGASVFFIWLVLNSGGIFVLETLVRSYLSGVELIRLAVSSFQEYEEKVAVQNGNFEYAVTINLTGPADWPCDSKISSADKITEIYIVGFMSIKTLFCILSQTIQTKKLYLINSRENICSGNHANILKELPNEMLRIASIKTLSFDSFGSSCTLAYQAINNHLTFSEVQEFSLSNSIINDDNAGILQNILRDSKLHLSSIKFSSVELDTKYFSWANIGVMPNVTSLEYDVSSSAKGGSNLDHIQLARQLPNLVNLTFGSQPRSRDEIRSAYGLVNLRHIEFGVSLPQEHANFSVAFLHKEFPRLESAIIFLNFTSCDEVYKKQVRTGRNFILDLHLLPSALLENIKVHSNCRLLTGYENRTGTE